ncbi:hypothetical protein SI65_02958 [Aspergillus cristatus]|uniref:Uncharacterized protein n=1 Tax=Aspergillus cristatus TaxID=573508 RepID=A0A1E3BMB4_ASPCR|nr:hypothetical protein SI65_02958 [Aspergillus cristatus]
METAPLTLAHTHARNAVLETRKANPVAASEEHDLAAGEFSTAANTSSDREALRTLQLLEGHHKKLAEILRFQHENLSSAVAAETTSSPATTPGLNAQQPVAQQPPRLSGNKRLSTRETSSSIASNLASARGIPSHPRRASPASPTLSSQQAGAKMTDSPPRAWTGESKLRGTQYYPTKDRTGRVSAPKQPWSPPSISPTDITSQQVIPVDAVDSPRQKRITEEPFQRFYSTFEGLISKISAPLAFAGLPLGTDANQAESTKGKSSAETRLDRQQAISDRPSTSTEPDVSKIFSKAALRAVRDGTNGGTNTTAESFYVVPTTGGTVSYAGILSRAEKEARRNSFEEVDEDFVDARETPSPEMRHSMTGAKSRVARGADKLTSLQNPKTLEELQMENQALKHLSDTLSKRLHMWEVNAQSSSMALQQSIRAMHHLPSPEHHPLPAPSGGSAATSTIAPLSAGPSTTDHEQRIKELEELVRTSEKELGQAGRENEKLRNVLGRYRERWEKLKEGAKTRRETQAQAAQQSRDENAAAASTTSTPAAAAAAAAATAPVDDDKTTDPGAQEDHETPSRPDEDADDSAEQEHESKDVSED